VVDSRRQLGGFAILALVLLRLAIGAHFFSEGLDKIGPAPETGRYRITFSAAEFLSQAKGPFESHFHSMAPSGHDWKHQLAEPKQNRPLTAEEEKAAAEHAPFQNWYARIVTDWQATLDKAIALPSLTEEQVAQAKAAFENRKQELKTYLQGESTAIAAYQHELWRLGQWEAKPEATGVPFQEERITTKATETTASARKWVADVAALDELFVADLREVLTSNAKAFSPPAIEEALTNPEQATLNWVNLGATILTIGVGICLLLGLFTRLASVAAAVFLLSIILSQPPWLPSAEQTIHQTVELAGLLVLAGTGAGRWLGLDYFSWALFRKHED
jgi:uncharacterized membrane protein YphA (DoxX/SURF4 family)